LPAQIVNTEFYEGSVRVVELIGLEQVTNLLCAQFKA